MIVVDPHECAVRVHIHDHLRGKHASPVHAAKRCGKAVAPGEGQCVSHTHYRVPREHWPTQRNKYASKTTNRRHQQRKAQPSAHRAVCAERGRALA